MIDFRFKSELLQDFNKRGLIYQITDPLFLDNQLISGQQLVFYLGVDPTAKSLHLGHLLWIMFIKKMQNLGHKPIIIVGGATSKIGDPTWKNAQRVMLEDDVIKINIEHIKNLLKKLISFQGTNPVVMLDNNDWTSNLNFLEFLREYGRFFSVNKMLSMDSVSARLENQQHLSFLEFSYSLLQAHDFLYLFQHHDCMLQVGGADQWSNIISGVDLVRRVTSKQIAGMTFPLLISASGVKMGKTENGAIWLDPSLTTPFDFWQYWRNIDDQDVIKLLKLFTNIPLCEINDMENWMGTQRVNEAKVRLADEVTSFVHPSENLESIHDTAKALFSSASTNMQEIKTFVLTKGITLDRAIVALHLANSVSEARRKITSGAVRVDKESITSIKYEIQKSCLISFGKKNFVKVDISSVE